MDPVKTAPLASFATIILMRWNGSALTALRQVPWVFRESRYVQDAISVKFCGSGKDGDFTLWPDVRLWVIVIAWRHADARSAFRASDYCDRLRSISRHFWMADLEPLQGHGLWGGTPLFDYSKRNSSGPVAVITRAAIRPSKAWDFWRHVPAARRATREAQGRRLSVGFGEFPILRQATFSVWESAADLKRFAYQEGSHREIVTLARERRWYGEELFARFDLMAVEGTWNSFTLSQE